MKFIASSYAVYSFFKKYHYVKDVNMVKVFITKEGAFSFNFPNNPSKLLLTTDIKEDATFQLWVDTIKKFCHVLGQMCDQPITFRINDNHIELLYAIF